MSTTDEPSSITDAAAAVPQSTTADGQTVAERSLPDLIAWEKHRAASKAVAGDATFGLRFGKIIPPGASGR